jgi:hypothetical protein
MLIPRTHAWSPVHKRLIVGAAVLALIGLGAFVYNYERNHRLPADSVLFGTWEAVMPHGMDSTDWMDLRPDHTVVWSSYSVAGYLVDSATARGCPVRPPP